MSNLKFEILSNNLLISKPTPLVDDEASFASGHLEYE
jgi:hypothetical protein